eukprot:gb/GFBE01001547.1/.p1 GENE.gb/GFBE01001547.1/~~gb/GFBE01001547.1/.p1  ORF type:complete len:322 (+),score=46.77 gb/GFBE01001547.1/:1-966(+)
MAVREVIYGKYYSKVNGDCVNMGNSFMLVHAQGVSTRQPTVIEIHGGGFTGGRRATAVTNTIAAYVNNGFTYTSLDYRLVATKYYFRDCQGREREEEFIAVTQEGRLQIPDERTVMSDYRVTVGRPELVTKCMYDASRAMDYIIEHSLELNVDVNRISFVAQSAGGGIANYLIWTYSKLRPGLSTPISATLSDQQLDYPVQNALDQVFSMFVGELGEGALLQDHLDQADCYKIVGNPWCTEPILSKAQTGICNSSWHDETISMYCGADFPRVTFGQLSNSQVWQPQNHQLGCFQKGAKGARCWPLSFNQKAKPLLDVPRAW